MKKEKSVQENLFLKIANVFTTQFVLYIQHPRKSFNNNKARLAFIMKAKTPHPKRGFFIKYRGEILYRSSTFVLCQLSR